MHAAGKLHSPAGYAHSPGAIQSIDVCHSFERSKKTLKAITAGAHEWVDSLLQPGASAVMFQAIGSSDAASKDTWYSSEVLHVARRLEVGMPFQSARKYVEITAGGNLPSKVVKFFTNRTATCLGASLKHHLFIFERIRSSKSKGQSFSDSTALDIFSKL